MDNHNFIVIFIFGAVEEYFLSLEKLSRELHFFLLF